LRYPAPENIFMVGEQPILTCWGFVRASAQSQPEDLLRAGLTAQEIPLSPPAPEPAPSAPPAASAPAPAREEQKKRFNLLLLLPVLRCLLLTLGLFYVLSLIPGCSDQTLWRGCSPRGSVSSAPAQSAPAESAPAQSAPAQPSPPSGAAPAPAAISPEASRELADLARREQELHARLQELRLRLLERASQCRVNPPVPPESPAPAETPPPPSLADLLPQTPEQAPREQTPSVQPETRIPPTREEIKPAPSPETELNPRPGTDLAIPEEAREKNDVSFLQGCWLSSSNMYNDETSEQVTVEYCFDRDGRGSRTVREANGKRCAGPVQARFNDSGRLIIDSEAADCDQEGSYVPQRVECAGSADDTRCQGRELDSQSLEWQARFRRQ
jgi:hypothetical protein